MALCHLTQTHKVLFGMWVVDEGKTVSENERLAWFDTGSGTQSSC